MEEQTFRECTDPVVVLKHLQSHTMRLHEDSVRVLRLALVAFCRHYWQLLASKESRNAIEVAERFADNPAAHGRDLASCYSETYTAMRTHPWSQSMMDTQGVKINDLAFAATLNGPNMLSRLRLWLENQRWSGICASILHDLGGNPCNPLPHRKEPEDPWLTEQVLSLAIAAYQTPVIKPCGFCRARGTLYCTKCSGEGCSPYGIMANGPCVADDLCPECHGEKNTNDGKLDPERILILGDALEEAGCPHPDILRHLRAGAPHYRGCYVLDWLLGVS